MVNPLDESSNVLSNNTGVYSAIQVGSYHDEREEQSGNTGSRHIMDSSIIAGIDVDEETNSHPIQNDPYHRGPEPWHIARSSTVNN